MATTPLLAPPPRAATPLFALASVISLGALAARMWHTGSLHFGFLVWNLVLAWVPYLAAVAIARRASRGRGVLLLGAAWLVFLPNAPYIVTDAVHLRRVAGVPLWFDAALIAAFAATGLGLGLVSLLLVHRSVASRFGARLGWLFVAAVLPLCALGVYLGRVHRFNSWDVVTDPVGLVHTLLFGLAGPVGYPVMAVLVVAMVGLLAVAYGVLWAALLSRGRIFGRSLTN